MIVVALRFDLFDEYAGGRHVLFGTYHLKPHSTWNIQRELKKQKGVSYNVYWDKK